MTPKIVRSKLARLGALMPALWLAGCFTVIKSTVNFERGTHALEAGDYPRAVAYLEEAVKLNPHMSKYHNNLAAAYKGAGRMQDGWPHVRRAVRLNPNNVPALANCSLYFMEMRKQTGLELGNSMDDVRQKLGEPDATEVGSSRTLWQYGIILLEFQDGRLTEIRDPVAGT